MRRVSATLKSSLRRGLLLGAALLVAACALVAPAPASGKAENPRLSSFLNGAVTFKLPEGWPVYMFTDDAAEFRDFYPEPPEGRLREHAFMTAEMEPEYNTLKEYVDAYYRMNPQFRHPAKWVISDTFDDESWRTAVGKPVINDVKYLTLERAGLVNHKRVSLGLSIPTEGVSPEMIRRVVEDFNAMCESLKIDGRNKFVSKLDADKIIERLGTDEEK